MDWNRLGTRKDASESLPESTCRSRTAACAIPFFLANSAFVSAVATPPCLCVSSQVFYAFSYISLTYLPPLVSASFRLLGYSRLPSFTPLSNMLIDLSITSSLLFFYGPVVLLSHTEVVFVSRLCLTLCCHHEQFAMFTKRQKPP